MTQADFTIANQTFPNTRTELNTSLQALATNSAGNSAPSTTFANQWWFDSDDNKLYMRNKDNDAWVEILTIGATSDKVESIGSGGGLTITTADNTDTLSLVSTDTDAVIGPNLNLYRNAGNGADADVIASIAFAGNDDAGNSTDFFRIFAQIQDASNGSEDIYVYFRSVLAGAEVQRINLDSTGMVINEDSKDLDFRVESDGNTHMLFVDGGNNSIGINNSTPSSYDGGADDLVVGSHSVSSQGITIAADDNSILYFADGTSGDEKYRGSIIYSHSNDAFTIRTAGFNTRMTIDSIGAVTMPTQPAFCAKPSSNQTNIAHNTTIACGTEIFDQNADFASSTFTAPVNGKYQLSFNIRLQDLQSNSSYVLINISTSNRLYQHIMALAPHVDGNVGFQHFSNSLLVDMDANDTALLNFQESGGTTGQVTVSAGESFFTGYLVC